MLLILSGQYVESELAAEFGRIPPAFLPLGNQRLYEHQVTALGRHHSEVAMTLPGDFPLDTADAEALEALRVRVLRTPNGASLGAAALEALTKLPAEGEIDILYGDTLVYEDAMGGTDWIGVGGSDDFYPWHYDSETAAAGDGAEAWAGVFSFSSAPALCELLRQDGDFIAAVTRYGLQHRPLERRSLKRWLDFGHVHTYFHSRLAVTTQRAFNHLAVAQGVLTKSSEDRQKMLAEAAWFEGAPAQIRPFLPNFIGAEKERGPCYSIEYLPLTALNELYVFGRLPVKVWNKVFAACDRYLRAERAVPVTQPCDGDFNDCIYRDKTMKRLEDFARQTDIDVDREWRFNGTRLPSLRAMAEEAVVEACGHHAVSSFVHGDFCFSNILYDFRSDRVKLVDPRGLDAGGRITSFGDFRYDVAKLGHSVLGLYDLIIAGRFRLRCADRDLTFEVADGATSDIRQAFSRTAFAGATPQAWDCQPIMVLLFLSMLPLHADRPLRQRALMANCMRIYREWAA
jgi:hypothetical protein